MNYSPKSYFYKSLKKFSVLFLLLGILLLLSGLPATATTATGKPGQVSDSSSEKSAARSEDKAREKEQAAQQSEEEQAARQVTEKYEIVVTAPRIEIPLKQNPAATSVVETSVLKSLPRTIAIDEVMKLVPGVKVDNQADGERVHISIRGEGILTERCTRGLRAAVDGVPLVDPSGYISDFYDVDWSTVRRIEVLRGPAAAFYGSSSSGGIINIFTRDGGSEPFSGSASLIRGAFGLKKGQAEMGGTTGIMNYHLSGSILDGKGYRDHSAYSADNLWGKFTFTLNPRVKITAVTGWTNFFNENPEGLNLAWFMDDVKTLRRRANPDAYSFNEYQRTRRLTSAVTTSVKFSDSLDFNASAYYRRTQYKEAVPSSVIHRGLDTPGLTLQLNHRAGQGKLKNYFSLGLDYSCQAIDEFKHPNLGEAVEGPAFLSDQNMYQNAVGIFLLDRVEAGPFWGVSGIVRFDRLSNRLEDHLQAGGVDLSGQVSFQRVTGRLGLTWNPLSNFGLYASWERDSCPGNRGWLITPTPMAVITPSWYPPPQAAKKSAPGEPSVRKSATTWPSSISTPGMTSDGTAGLTDRWKLSMETSAQPEDMAWKTLAWLPVENLTIQAAYTYYHFKYRTVDTLAGETLSGTWVPNIPQHQLYIDGEYRLTGRLSLGAAVEHVSSWYIDSTNRILENGYGKTEPYTLVHVRASYRFEFGGTPFEIRLAGRNIFNVLYYGFTEPDPDGNSYQPAPTAEWSLGVRVGF